MDKERFFSYFPDPDLRDQVRKTVETAPEAKKARREKLFWVLSPGFLRGWLQFGAMDVLNTLGLEPDGIVGSSIGAYVGLVPAAKKDITFVEEAQKEYDRKVFAGKNETNQGLFSTHWANELLMRKFLPSKISKIYRCLFTSS